LGETCPIDILVVKGAVKRRISAAAGNTKHKGGFETGARFSSRNKRVPNKDSKAMHFSRMIGEIISEQTSYTNLVKCKGPCQRA
jgi:hypothetical protein